MTFFTTGTSTGCLFAVELVELLERALGVDQPPRVPDQTATELLEHERVVDADRLELPLRDRERVKP